MVSRPPRHDGEVNADGEVDADCRAHTLGGEGGTVPTQRDVRGQVPTRGGDRGQAHTLEAITASLAVLMSIVIVLQVSAVTPLTASTSSQHVENQHAAMADSLLASEVANGTVTTTLLYWNESAARFHGATGRGYLGAGPPTAFGAVLNRTFLVDSIAINVNVHYLRADRSRDTVRLVYSGEPSTHASAASRLVTLIDSQALRNPDGTKSATTLEEGSYFAPDLAPQATMYNVVDVEVVVWRT